LGLLQKVLDGNPNVISTVRVQAPKIGPGHESEIKRNNVMACCDLFPYLVECDYFVFIYRYDCTVLMESYYGEAAASMVRICMTSRYQVRIRLHA